MASYTVYLREWHPGKDRRNARAALALLRSAGVPLDVERGPNAVNQEANRTRRSVYALRLPQIFHGEKHIGGVGPLKKYLAAQGPSERRAIEDLHRRERVRDLEAEIAIEEVCADAAERRRDHALRCAEQAETARSAAVRRRDEMKTKLRTEETGVEAHRNEPDG